MCGITHAEQFFSRRGISSKGWNQPIKFHRALSYFRIFAPANFFTSPISLSWSDISIIDSSALRIFTIFFYSSDYHFLFSWYFNNWSLCSLVFNNFVFGNFFTPSDFTPKKSDILNLIIDSSLRSLFEFIIFLYPFDYHFLVVIFR